MPDIIGPELTTLAFCWRIERRDGVTIGFTSHDRDLWIGGLAYRAAPGMLPSAIELSDGFDADMLSVGGALSSAAIREADLAAGRWDGAVVKLFMASWEAPDAAAVPVARGVLGDIRISGNGFETELRGAAALLDRPVVEQTSPECRASLGDRRCRVDMAGRVRITRVAVVSDDETIEVESAAQGPDLYAYGRLRWLGGANSGLESAILSSAGAVVRLREPPPRVAAAGDLIELREGCDKRFSTCIARFANAENFRGEPHLPGIDLLTRYPGAS
jgi:uncharacterized phage protein (TIGR02218 family)